MPDAQVTLTNTATGVARQAQSSASGVYYFGAVPIGSYKLVVSKQGFEEWAGNFTLEVGQNAVVNAALRVGGSTTVVEVSGAVAPIETTGGSVADVKESTQIHDLPLNGRQIGLLFGLTAGVESGAGGARVNGMKVGSLDINLDGVTMVDRFGGGIVRALKPSRSFALKPWVQTQSSTSRPRSSWSHAAARINCAAALTNITVTIPCSALRVCAPTL